MLHEEFEKLIGRKATEEEYVRANAMYMFIPDLEKKEFCDLYQTREGCIALLAMLDNEWENVYKRVKEDEAVTRNSLQMALKKAKEDYAELENSIQSREDYLNNTLTAMQKSSRNKFDMTAINGLKILSEIRDKIDIVAVDAFADILCKYASFPCVLFVKSRLGFGFNENEFNELRGTYISDDQYEFFANVLNHG